MKSSPVIFMILCFHSSFCLTVKKEECVLDEKPLTVELESGPVNHGEGPHWDDEEKTLFYVDIAGSKLHKYNPKTKSSSYIKLNDSVSLVVPVRGEKNTFLIGLGRKISKLFWDGASNSSLTTLTEVDNDKPKNRLNDGKVSPTGELWFGSMGEESADGMIDLNKGSLFRLRSGVASVAVTPVSISNGLAWTKDNRTMFYIDSPTRRVDAFDYDVVSGNLSNRRTFFDLTANEVPGFPDGMTIDEEDNLWVAVWGGSRVLQISPTGCLKRTVSIPTKRVTSVVFGGDDLHDLFVTTMKDGDDPKGGALFVVRNIPEKGTLSRRVWLGE